MALDEFDKELVRLGRELEGVLGGDAKEIIDKIRQHEIDLETAADRIGDHNRMIERSDEEAQILVKEREGAENARSQAEQKISDLHQSVSDSKEDLKRAAREEQEARKAIESGDKHGRDLNRALGLSLIHI